MTSNERISTPDAATPDAATPGNWWRTRAACRPGSGVELFFPAAGSGPAHDAQVAEAKTVCAGCPVRAACLAEALARIPHGVAGGLTEHERRDLRGARRRRPPRPAGPVAEEVEAVLREDPQGDLTVRMTTGERARLARSLLTAGRTAAQVARTCQVSTRTVQRWASTHADAMSTISSTTACADTQATCMSAGEGSRGGHEAAPGVSAAPGDRT